MGTNYYWYKPLPGGAGRCTCCGRAPGVDKFHIGKSSAGWCFSLHVNFDMEYVYPPLRIVDLSDWVQRFQEPETWILDEYSDLVPVEKMLQIIRERGYDDPSEAREQTLRRHADRFDFHANYAVDGPRGLLRHKISEYARCVGHGEGPWDLIIGEFS